MGSLGLKAKSKVLACSKLRPAHSSGQGCSLTAGDIVFAKHLQELKVPELTIAGLSEPGVEGVEHPSEFECFHTPARDIPVAWLFTPGTAAAHFDAGAQVQAASNDLDVPNMLDTWIGADDDGTGSIAVTIEWPQEAQKLQEAAQGFVEALRSALDHAVALAEKTVSGSLTTPAEPAQFHLCSSLGEFIDHYEGGALTGLRPDHIKLLQTFQPFAEDPDDSTAVNLVRRTMRLLSNLTQRKTNSNVVTVWAHSASPVVLVDAPQVVAELTVEPAGRVLDTYTVARSSREPAEPARRLRGNPQVALDISFDAELWPIDPDDTFDLRCHQLLAVTAETIRSFERSFGLRSAEHRRVGRDWAPSTDRVASTWSPVDVSSVPEMEPALSESDLGLAVYRATQVRSRSTPGSPRSSASPADEAMFFTPCSSRTSATEQCHGQVVSVTPSLIELPPSLDPADQFLRLRVVRPGEAGYVAGPFAL